MASIGKQKNYSKPSNYEEESRSGLLENHHSINIVEGSHRTKTKDKNITKTYQSTFENKKPSSSTASKTSTTSNKSDQAVKGGKHVYYDPVKELHMLKKAIIVTLTQASFDFDESGKYSKTKIPSVDTYIMLYDHLKSKFKRLFSQNFVNVELLLFSMSLFQKVLKNADAAEILFSLKNDSIFKIFLVCFFLANKFTDELRFISASDMAYMAHSSESFVKSLEIALLNDILGWRLLELRKINENGEYTFMDWDYRYTVK
jgi:hypothetical protein